MAHTSTVNIELYVIYIARNAATILDRISHVYAVKNSIIYCHLLVVYTASFQNKFHGIKMKKKSNLFVTYSW